MGDRLKDQDIEVLFGSLQSIKIDLIVSGSIGATESVKFIRCLRRLGATVFVWLTEGGKQFVTPTALEWASGNPVREKFSGLESHVRENDLLIIAPLSASFLSGLASGATHTPSLALASSYLGDKFPVMVLPNMHDSMFHSPILQENLKKISNYCHILKPRTEESKQKYPDPEVLANGISHIYNQKKMGNKPILITMGTTKGFIDDVRYISNYSSGGLGSIVSEHLYRLGFQTHIICGPCEIKPKSFYRMNLIETTEQMLNIVHESDKENFIGGIFLASVLDFVPSKKLGGKVKSSDTLTVDFKPTPKIISHFSGKNRLKVGFKLEAKLDKNKIIATYEDYSKKYNLSFFVFNLLEDVSSAEHKAIILEGAGGDLDSKIENESQWLYSKPEIAKAIGERFKKFIAMTNNFSPRNDIAYPTLLKDIEPYMNDNPTFHLDYDGVRHDYPEGSL